MAKKLYRRELCISIQGDEKRETRIVIEVETTTEGRIQTSLLFTHAVVDKSAPFADKPGCRKTLHTIPGERAETLLEEGVMLRHRIREAKNLRIPLFWKGAMEGEMVDQFLVKALLPGGLEEDA